MGSVVMLKNYNNIEEGNNFIKRFLERYSSEDTIIAYDRIIRHFFKVEDIYLISLDDIKYIDSNDAEDYVKELSKTYATKSVKQSVGCLRAMYNYAVKKNIVKVNYFADKEISELIKLNCKKEECNGRALTEEEIYKLYETIKEYPAKSMCSKKKLLRDELLFKLMFRTGLRESEVIKFNMEDIIYNSFTNKHYIKIVGKGNKERIIQLTEEMYQDLIKWDTINDNDTVFGFKSSNNINKLMEKWGERSGLGHLTPHDTRRTFATNLYRKGINIYKLKKILGHESIRTTEGYIKEIYKYEQDLDEYISW